jgi:hypothetical protein
MHRPDKPTPPSLHGSELNVWWDVNGYMQGRAIFLWVGEGDCTPVGLEHALGLFAGMQ